MTGKVKGKPEIMLALDGMSIDDAILLAKKLSGLGAIFKVNDLLDTDYGLKIIPMLSEFGLVVADAKYHDIPDTVDRRVAKCASYKPFAITIHASGGIAMMRAAVKSAGESKIMAVTVLTSISEEVSNINFGAPTKAKVLQYAREAVLAGVHGIVCSVKELNFLAHKDYSETHGLIKMTPGIRPPDLTVKNDDQARTGNIVDAITSDYLVIGRPITKANDPVEAFKTIQQQIDEAWKIKLEG
ncbi:MAG: orotidine-5'-phosphate decarboxylase, partial [bacterium]